MNKNDLARHWWVIVMRGVAAVIFGLAACVWPTLTGLALVLVFGAYAVVDGALAVVAGVTRRGRARRRWALLAEGGLGIAVGLAAFAWPALTALSVIYLIAGWAIATGVVEIAAAIQLRRDIDDEWLLALGGVVSMIVGVLLVFQPAAGGVAVVWSFGWYALVFGALLIVWGLRLKGVHDHGTAETRPLKPARGAGRSSS